MHGLEDKVKIPNWRPSAIWVSLKVDLIIAPLLWTDNVLTYKFFLKSTIQMKEKERKDYAEI